LTRNLRSQPDQSAAAHLELAFEDNRLVSQLYGEFDQNLALIEQRLGVQANSRGNHVMLRGGANAVDQARRALESLYDMLEEGKAVGPADVDGVIRMVQSEDSQLSLPTLEKRGKVRMAQIASERIGSGSLGF